MEPRTRGPMWEPGAGGVDNPNTIIPLTLGFVIALQTVRPWDILHWLTNLGKKVVEKLTKLSKIDFSMEHFTAYIWHARIPRLWTQVLDVGLWRLDSGHWTLDSGCLALEAGLWMPDSGRWSHDAGLWMLDSGRWTLNVGRWALNTGHCYWLFRTESESSFWFYLIKLLKIL